LTKTISKGKLGGSKTRDKLSKSFCQPNYRKLLIINSPDETEAKNNEKKVIETLNKAIANNTVKNVTSKAIEPIKLASSNLSDSNKTRLRNVIKVLSGGYKYLGEGIKDIDDANILIVKISTDINKDPKILYTYFFRNIKIVNYLYFLDSEKKEVNMDNYIVKPAIDIDRLNRMKTGKYMVNI
jgi:hypothetical protein